MTYEKSHTNTWSLKAVNGSKRALLTLDELDMCYSYVDTVLCMNGICFKTDGRRTSHKQSRLDETIGSNL